MNRLIGKIYHFDGLVVQSINFNKFLPIGCPKILAEYFCKWSVDEILICDISASIENRLINLKLVKDISKIVNIPVAVGGGIKSISDVSKIIDSGAEKVILNSNSSNSKLINLIATKFGSQSIICSLDYKKINRFHYAFLKSGTLNTFQKLKDYFCFLNDLSIGEIMLNSIDRDGSKNGFDFKNALNLNKISKKPLIISGGFDHPKSLKKLLENRNISVALGNSLNFFELSMAQIKNWLKKNNRINLRYNLSYNSSPNRYNEFSK